MDRTGRFVVIAVAAAALLAGAGGARAADRVTLRADVFLSGQHAPFFLGIDKGFYREEGLDLEVQPGTGSGTTLKLVGNGNDTFGYADAGALVKAVTAGIPVKNIMGILQRNPMTIVALKDSGIASPKDLVGKRMAGTPGSSMEQLFPAFCTATKIDCSTITMVQTDVQTKSKALLAKRVDATFVSQVNSVPVLEDAVGGPISVLKYADHGINMLGTNLVTNRDLIKSNPDLVRRFVKATARSWKYALAHPDETQAAFLKRTDKVKPQVVKRQMEESFTLLQTARTKGRPLGWMSPDDWSESVQILRRYGGLTEPVPIEDVFTNDFVPAS